MISTTPHDNCLCIHGWSSDTKPTKHIYNGSVFIEVDTGNEYMFDGASNKWLKYDGGYIEMITAINEHVYQYSGLSTDVKPTDDLTDTGSRFIEMDTSKIYMYYKPTKTWHLFKTGGGSGSDLVAGDNISIENNVISAVDTKYTAGKNIEITDDNVINATTCDCTLKELITAEVSVGGVTVGDKFPAGTPIEEVIRQILSKMPTPPTPTIDGKLFWGTVDSTPEEVTGEFTEQDIPQNIKTAGIRHTYSTVGFQYECFVFPSKLGKLTKIYENGMTMFNLISNYTFKEIEIEDEIYYLYYYIDPVKATGDEFEFYWN